MTSKPLSLLKTQISLVWAFLIFVLMAGGSFAYACGAPFAAVAALCAIEFKFKEGVATVLAAFLVNQLIGFLFLSYPVEASSIMWGVIIGVSMLVGFFTARMITRGSRLVSSSVIAFLAAFTVFQGMIYLAALVLGGTEAFTTEAIAWVFAINSVAFLGMLALYLTATAHNWLGADETLSHA